MALRSPKIVLASLERRAVISAEERQSLEATCSLQGYAGMCLADVVEKISELSSRMAAGRTDIWELDELEIIMCKIFLDSPDRCNECYEPAEACLRRCLMHAEPRVRMWATSLIPGLIRVGQIEFYTSLSHILLEDISSKMFKREQEEKPTLLGSDFSVPLDNTAGWSTLETSLRALEVLFRAAWTNIYVHIVTQEHRDMLSLTDEQVSLVVGSAAKHVSRHIKQAGFAMITAILSVSQDTLCVSHHQREIMRDAIASGLEDNWTQVRYSASEAARVLIMSVPENERLNLLYNVLLPRLCMNRFYIADGVRNYSQETWSLVMGCKGRDYIKATINDVVEYYVTSTRGVNHMIIESACAAIAELASKIDRASVRPFARRMYEALLECLQSDSWPVSDGACIATAVLVKHHPLVFTGTNSSREDCQIVLAIDNLLSIYFIHLQDSIWSIRCHAAEALGELLNINDINDNIEIITLLCTRTLERVIQYLDANTIRATLQAASDERKRAPQFIPSKFLTAMTRGELLNSSSSSSTSTKKAVDIWDCCLDCNAVRKSGDCDWEISDGCIYLLKEISQSHPPTAAKFIGNVLGLIHCRDFKDSERLHKTIYDYMPYILRSCSNEQRIEISSEIMRTICVDASEKPSTLRSEAATAFLAFLQTELGY